MAELFRNDDLSSMSATWTVTEVNTHLKAVQTDRCLNVIH